MGVFATYSNLMTYILPIICSAICSVFTFFLIWNYRNLAERKLRRVVSIYLYPDSRMVVILFMARAL